VAAIGVDALVEKIGAQLGGVDEVVNVGEKYQGIIIAKLVKCEDHPNADRLHVCTIDDGGKMPDVARDENGHVQVVCGAPNVREGLTVAWLPPGATVPETVGKEPFVLEARELRGVVSNGMLASPKELALGDSHAGLLEIDGDYAPGTDFAEAFGLKDDVLIDIENKMFTHRPDCFGFLGVARELAGIQSMPYKSPEWYRPQPTVSGVESDVLPLTVQNELPALVSRFSAITMRDVQVGPSPVWLQVELAKVGSRSINNIVDYTNFFMLQTSQPLHAYDYDKVKALSDGDGATIVVRNPKPGEKVKLLNGKEIEPRAEAIMIATNKQLIGIGGVMGGADTEVDETTKNIIIESANFDMYSIRRTAMTHGLFTDAVTRFNKGQSPLQTVTVLAKIIDEIQRYTGGKVASELIDDNHLDPSVLERGSLYTPVTVSAEFINSRLGLSLSAQDMKTLLENVEFNIAAEGDNLTVTAPFWRTDIELREDVVEEIGRLYGYDKLPLALPVQDISPTQKDPMFELKAHIRDSLSKAGANEVLTYSFVHGDLLEKVGQDKDRAFQISNALSPDLQYFRLSLTPSLLEKIHPNIKAGYDEFALFEIGKAHIHGQNDSKEANIPKELNSLAFVYASKKSQTGAPYYEARTHLNQLLTDFKVAGQVRLEPLQGADLHDNAWVAQLVAPYAPQRSAVVRDSEGRIWGVVGEFKSSVRRSLKLPEYSAGFEIGPLLLTTSSPDTGYVPLPRFPKVSQDVTLKVPASLEYQKLFDFVWTELGKVQPENTLPNLSPVDIYQRPDDPKHKQITLRLTIASYDRTLTDTEVNKLLDTVAQAAKTALDAERV
ncbi:MAG: Phenylalanine-tRNA ligase beta subunit, partial [Candidatus Saccharibacteria bacterium]|nr:Phenylalanine-tRNA ligase beta subunit [Candidatus Saccharibacteria bacterium]